MTRQATSSNKLRNAALTAVMLLASAFFAIGAEADDDALAQPTPAYTDTLIYWPTDIMVEAEVVADTTKVEQRRLTLEEIIERCIEGEQNRLAGHEDMTYTATLRAAIYWKKKKKIEDSVLHIYSDAEEYTRAVLLEDRTTSYKLEDGEWVLDEDEDEEDSGPVSVETGGYSDFTDLPVFLEALGEYRFELVERTIEVDHVIFKIAFEPKSEFQPLPRGLVYVDTSDYRIIYEEYDFDQNPFPLVLKDMKRMTRHWGELPTGEWVFTRVMMEVDLRGDPFGWIPDRVAVVMLRDDFKFDQGYDARVFGKR